MVHRHTYGRVRYAFKLDLRNGEVKGMPPMLMSVQILALRLLKMKYLSVEVKVLVTIFTTPARSSNPQLWRK